MLPYTNPKRLEVKTYKTAALHKFKASWSPTLHNWSLTRFKIKLLEIRKLIYMSPKITPKSMEILFRSTSCPSCCSHGHPGSPRAHAHVHAHVHAHANAHAYMITHVHVMRACNATCVMLFMYSERRIPVSIKWASLTFSLGQQKTDGNNILVSWLIDSMYSDGKNQTSNHGSIMPLMSSRVRSNYSSGASASSKRRWREHMTNL